jgi:hypothetical protein
VVGGEAIGELFDRGIQAGSALMGVYGGIAANRRSKSATKARTLGDRFRALG